MTFATVRGGVLLAVLALCGCSLTHAVKVASDNQTLASAMTADKTFPQLSQEIRYVNLFATDMAEYVDAADSECTMIAPDNTAIQKTMTGLGSYVGLFLQNQTMHEQVLNHHVIPNHIIKAADFGDGSKPVAYKTRANQTVWLLQRNGQPYVAFGEKYVLPLQIADIRNKRNKCVLHVISDQALIPPSLLSTFEDWQQQAGKPQALASPQATWIPNLQTAATAATTTEAAQGSADAAAAAPAAVAAAPAEAASKPASGASSVTAGKCIAAAVAAAAALLLGV